MKKQCFDLSQLDWQLTGWIAEFWRMQQTMEIGASPNAEVRAIPAKVPGSVQYALREAGIIPDWNVGMSFRQCEWVENRHWVYETALPDEWFASGKTFRLNCLGLDYRGCVMVNGKVIGEFIGTHVPHVFYITPFLAESSNRLAIVFECPPRWLGQFGYTSKMTEWKPRFNYAWDWTVRLVQIGIWAGISIEAIDGAQIESFRCVPDAEGSQGTLRSWGKTAGGKSVRLALSRNGRIVREQTLPGGAFDVTWTGLAVDLWNPNMHGDQPLYDLTCTLLDADGAEVDASSRTVGFRHVEWRQCEGAPEGADPWICVVNGKPIFLQGVNWNPIRSNFADVTEADYRKRLELYRDLGCNLLRVWGGAVLETEVFYDLCDELGLMVWQEFPLSSSGIENWPPEDERSIAEQSEIALSYIERRQNHASLIIWCGGNELLGALDGGKVGGEKPVDLTHPLLARFAEIVEREDPTRRFLPTSASGPRGYAHAAEFGKGLHWDVHGPWKADGDLDGAWTDYWSKDDALFRSETGSPGACSAEITRRYAGDLDPMPATADNPLWSRHTSWWVEWPTFVAEHGREPRDLDEYVAWSQARQSKALSIAVRACKSRFPRCGGILLWTGHDCFPCAANTSIIDFDGNPKPAALALKEIWQWPV